MVVCWGTQINPWQNHEQRISFHENAYCALEDFETDKKKKIFAKSIIIH